MRISILILLVVSLFALVAIPIDAADDEHVSFIGGDITGTAIAQGTLYLSQPHGITILDVRDRANIRVIGHYRQENYQFDALAVKWPVLFFVGHIPGQFSRHLGALNVTTPSQPLKIDTVDPDSGKIQFQFAIHGSRLIFDSRRHYVYDISDPFHPKEMIEEENADEDKNDKAGAAITQKNNDATTESIQSTIHGIAPTIFYAGRIFNVKDAGKGRIYVFNKDAMSVDLLDVTDPRAPRYLRPVGASEMTQDMMSLGRRESKESEDLIFKGHYKISVFVLNTGGDDSRSHLALQDISNKSSPKTIQTFAGEWESFRDPGAVVDYWMNGYILCFMTVEDRNTWTWQLSLNVIDLSDPEAPRGVGTFEGFEDTPKQVLVSGKRVYVADESNGLRIIELK